MLRYIFAAACVIAPIDAFAESVLPTLSGASTIPQMSVFQKRGNRAVTMQIGTNNRSTIGQHGQRNYAAVVQSGNGHVQNIQQVGDNMAYGSTQVTSRHGTVNFTKTGGNAKSPVTIHISITPDTE